MGKVIITGAAGFLGSHLADKYLDEGWEVVGVDNLVGGYYENIPDGVRFFEADLTDRKIIEATFWDDADLVIHAAALATEGLSVFSPALLVESNVQATVNALTASARNSVKRFVYLSSMARYGDLGAVFTEDMDCKPQDPYGIAKLASEKLVENICETHGMEWTVMVPHNIIGSRQKYDDPYRNVASIFINRMLQGKQPILYGDGLQMRSFSFVQDVVEPLYKAAQSPDCIGEVINVGPDENECTVLELAQTVAAELDFELDPIFVPDRPREVKKAFCSSDKARRLLDWEAKTTMQEGIAEMVEWIKSNGAKPFEYHLPIEIQNEKTPETWTKKLM
jgi:UDP-glucose 4-epimerase